MDQSGQNSPNMCIDCAAEVWHKMAREFVSVKKKQGIKLNIFFSTLGTKMDHNNQNLCFDPMSLSDRLADVPDD